MNVLIPISGKNVSFEDKGLPQPLTLVNGKPIIQLISESRPYSFMKAIFIVLESHEENYSMSERLKDLFGSDIRVKLADKSTAEAPQSALLARSLIDSEEPLIIDYADQYLDLPGFMDFIMDTKAGGVIPTFESVYSKRAYMTYEDGKVSSVSENPIAPISTHAASCISFFRNGSDFIQSADSMVAKGRIPSEGSRAISLAYNEMIEAGKKILPFSCDLIMPMETFEAVGTFEQHAQPLRCGKEIFRQRVSERQVFQYRGKRPRPENSITSLKTALDFGFSAEIDVRMAKDGSLFLSHDDDLSKVVGSSTKISKSTVGELSRLCFTRTDENLAQLDDALDLISKRAYGVLAIHVEDSATVGLVQQICTRILSRGLENRTFVFGDGANSEPVARLVKNAYPAVKTGFHLEAEKFKNKLPQDIDVLWVYEKKKGGITSAIRAAAKKAGALSIAMSPELLDPKVSKNEASSRCKDFFGFAFDAVCTSYF